MPIYLFICLSIHVFVYTSVNPPFLFSTYLSMYIPSHQACYPPLLTMRNFPSEFPPLFLPSSLSSLLFASSRLNRAEVRVGRQSHTNTKPMKIRRSSSSAPGGGGWGVGITMRNEIQRRKEFHTQIRPGSNGVTGDVFGVVTRWGAEERGG